MTNTTRTAQQQAAYDRMTGTAATVREQQESGIIPNRYAPVAHWEDALITPAADVVPAPRYAVTTNHPDARAPYAMADTRIEAIRLAHELHALRAERAANGVSTGAVLVRDTEYAYGGAFIFRIDADGTARAL